MLTYKHPDAETLLPNTALMETPGADIKANKGQRVSGIRNIPPGSVKTELMKC